MNRFEWSKAVLHSKSLSDRAKVLASILALVFFNDETGQLNPSIPTLAEYQGVSEDTIKRAVSDLTKAGWLGKTSGLGRGNSTVFVLLSPGNVVTIRPQSTTDGRGKIVHMNDHSSARNEPASRAKRVQPSPLSSNKKGCRTAPKRVQNCIAHIRKEQSLEQRGGERPSPHLRVIVSIASWYADEWAEWLASHHLPNLCDLPALSVTDGYCLPWKRPPTDSDSVAVGIAVKIIDWAKNWDQRHVAA